MPQLKPQRSEVKLGELVIEGWPTQNGSVQVILRSERGMQEAFVSFAEWTSIAQIGGAGADELRRLRAIEKVAKVISEHWRDQHGVNAGLLDLLAEASRHG